MSERKLYYLINPSDRFTFYASSVQVAGYAVRMISSKYGARAVDDSEVTPVMFGWNEWFKDCGIDKDWVTSHRNEIIECLDSFMLCDEEERPGLDAKRDYMTDDQWKAFYNDYLNMNQSSLNCIADRVAAIAEELRELS